MHREGFSTDTRPASRAEAPILKMPSMDADNSRDNPQARETLAEDAT